MKINPVNKYLIQFYVRVLSFLIEAAQGETQNITLSRSNLPRYAASNWYVRDLVSMRMISGAYLFVSARESHASFCALDRISRRDRFARSRSRRKR